MSQSSRPKGMLAFTIIIIGQVISILGTSMSNFGLTIWAYQETKQATALALIGFFFVTPQVIIAPLAGAMVDRYNRRLMMMLSDLAAGFTTIIQLVLFATGSLEIWHLYVTAFVAGTFQTFQWPAFSAAISTMLPKEQYGRASGMQQLGNSAVGIVAPALAAALLAYIGLKWILVIDVITFSFAIGALLFVHIPQPKTTEAGREGQGSIWKESAFGFRYILARPSLLGLQLVFFFGNLFSALGFTLYAPMILARTQSNELIFGSVNSVAGIGGVVGALVMSAWGGPKRRVHGVLAGWIITSLLGEALLGLGRGLPVWAVSAFAFSFFIPVINGSNQAIWQSKVPPDIQGRVFSIRMLIAWFVSPLARLVAGPLADQVFEPAMAVGGNLAGAFGWLVGTGPGSGMALILIFAGLGAMLSGLGGYLFRMVRDVEQILPDHDAVAVEAGAEALA